MFSKKSTAKKVVISWICVWAFSIQHNAVFYLENYTNLSSVYMRCVGCSSTFPSFISFVNNNNRLNLNFRHFLTLSLIFQYSIFWWTDTPYESFAPEFEPVFIHTTQNPFKIIYIQGIKVFQRFWNTLKIVTTLHSLWWSYGVCTHAIRTICSSVVINHQSWIFVQN